MIVDRSLFWVASATQILSVKLTLLVVDSIFILVTYSYRSHYYVIATQHSLASGEIKLV
jgi:hypothetical protein